MKLSLNFNWLMKSSHGRRGLSMKQSLDESGSTTNDDANADLLVENLRTFVSGLRNAELQVCQMDASCTISVDGMVFVIFLDGPDDVCVQAMFAQVKPLPPRCIQKLKVWKVHVEWNYSNQAGISRHMESSLLHDPRAFIRRVDSFMTLSRTLAERQQVKRVVSLSRT